MPTIPFFNAPDSSAPLSTAGGLASLADIFGASVNSFQLTASTIAAGNALESAYNARIAAIKDATGQELQNPMLSQAQDMVQPGIIQQRRDAFAKRMAELATQFPDKAPAFTPDVPVEKQAEALANAADARVGTLMAARPGWDKWVANLGGQVIGGLTDPVNAIAMLAGGPETTAAKTAVGRILTTATREAVINGGIAAVSQPNVQAWRKKVGLSNGLVDAAQQIAMGAVGGAVLGGGTRALWEGAGRLFRPPEAARGAAPVDLRPETQPAPLPEAPRDAAAAHVAENPAVDPRVREALKGDSAAAADALAPIRDTLPPEVRGAMDAQNLDNFDRAAVADAAAPAVSMTVKEARDFYTSIGSYQINQWLRTGEFPAKLAFADREKAAAAIAKLVQSAEPLPADTVVYRGIPARDINSDPHAGFTSVSTDPAIAHDYARGYVSKGNEGAVVKSVLPAGTPVIKGAVGEGELILPPGATLRAQPPAIEALPSSTGVHDVPVHPASFTPGDPHAVIRDNLDLAKAAAAGDSAALDALARQDPELAPRVDAPPEFPQDIPGPEGLDNPYDTAQVDHELDQFSDASLDMPVLDENGDIVPLRDLIEAAKEDEGLSRLVRACRV